MGDKRDYADIGEHKYIDGVDDESMTVTYKLPNWEAETEEDAHTKMDMPGKYKVCPTCEGRGTHVDPGVDRNGITMSEMRQLGPYFEETYFSGGFDVRCGKCKGKRVMLTVDTEHLNSEQEEFYKKVQEQVDSDFDFRNLQLAERSMGA